jgi:hypothetical protein
VYKFASRPRITTKVFSAPAALMGVGVFALATILKPAPSPHIDFRSFTANQGVKVYLHPAAPPFAALEDQVLPDEEISIAAIPKQSVQLQAGELSFASKASEIIAENLESQKTLNASAPYAYVAADSAGLAQAAWQQTNRTFATAANQSAIAQASETHTVNLSDLHITREELLQAVFIPMARSVQVSVAAAKPKAQPVGKSFAYNRPPIPPSDSESVIAAEPLSLQMQARKAKSVIEESSASLSATPVESTGQTVLAGPIELSGGLALSNPNDQLVVYRQKDNHVFESGYVWLQQGRYEIVIDEPVGTLVAELRSSDGERLGRGTIELQTLPQIGTRAYRLDNVILQLRPAPTGISGRVVSGYSYAEQAFAIGGASLDVDAAPHQMTTLKDGSFHDPNLLEGSSVILKTHKAGHWGSLSFATTARDSTITVFPDKMMTQLAALWPQAAQDPNEMAMVWGRVTHKGKPVAGAQVQFLTSEKPLRPVYFNSMRIPDPQLNATTANGLYAFFPVDPGVHAIQASYHEYLSEPVLFPAEQRYVSNMEVETASSSEAKINVYDAFQTSHSLSAQVSNASHDHSVRIAGQGAYKFTPGASLLVLDVDAGADYSLTRLTLAREGQRIYAPMLAKDWLAGLKTQLNWHKTQDTGVVVGFIEGSSSYQAFIDGDEAPPGARVFYFDRNGKVTNENVGGTGGGFVIVNVPQGFNTISIVPVRSQKILTATVLVDQNTTNVITHSFSR